jgi:hypothetical protein
VSNYYAANTYSSPIISDVTYITDSAYRVAPGYSSPVATRYKFTSMPTYGAKSSTVGSFASRHSSNFSTASTTSAYGYRYGSTSGYSYNVSNGIGSETYGLGGYAMSR